MKTDSAANAVEPKTRRRWFQFHLRTLFVVVTLSAVVCGYVGSQSKIVSNRKRLLQQNGAIGWLRDENDATGEIPAVRTWLGDESYRLIRVAPPTAEKTLEKYKAAFPEASIVRMDRTRFTY
jgi:hypothetical protein